MTTPILIAFDGSASAATADEREAWGTPWRGLLVARTMAEQSIHCVIVAGIARRDHSGERLGWGIVSDLDLMAALDPDTGAVSVGEIAGTEIVTSSPRDPLALAARLMAAHQTAHLVVVSPETGRPVGMLSTLDVARAADRA